MFNYQLSMNSRGFNSTKQIIFENNFSNEANKVISDIFQRLGGTTENGTEWKFPKLILTSHLKTIIDNTCAKCGGIVSNGNALQNTMVTFADFGDDAGTRGSTQARIGIAEPIEVSKCTSCGHSVKYLNPNNHE
jgi:hypothetical protein